MMAISTTTKNTMIMIIAMSSPPDPLSTARTAGHVVFTPPMASMVNWSVSPENGKGLPSNLTSFIHPSKPRIVKVQLCYVSFVMHHYLLKFMVPTFSD